MNKTWNSVSVGEKMALGCIFMNLCVFLGWKRTNPATIQFMERYFTASPFGKSPCASMFLSIFSHRSFLHLACNMTCLWSFASSAVEAVGKEQAAALYVSAGMTSSLLSYVCNVMRSSRTSSVGASGAILGLAGAVMTLFPDHQLIIIFLPMFPIAANYAVKGIIAVDLAGVALKWKFFDHAGHLGGTLCGVGFISYGQEFVLKYQKELVNVWHEFRE
jgi:rhomboid-like protein